MAGKGVSELLPVCGAHPGMPHSQMCLEGFGALNKGGVNLETERKCRRYWNVRNTVLETGFTPSQDLAGIPSDLW